MGARNSRPTPLRPGRGFRPFPETNFPVTNFPTVHFPLSGFHNMNMGCPQPNFACAPRMNFCAPQQIPSTFCPPPMPPSICPPILPQPVMPPSLQSSYCSPPMYSSPSLYFPSPAPYTTPALPAPMYQHQVAPVYTQVAPPPPPPSQSPSSSRKQSVYRAQFVGYPSPQQQSGYCAPNQVACFAPNYYQQTQQYYRPYSSQVSRCPPGCEPDNKDSNQSLNNHQNNSRGSSRMRHSSPNRSARKVN